MFRSAQNKLEGTVWLDVDDAKVFKILDLEDIERTFSAYQRQQVLRTIYFNPTSPQVLLSNVRGGWKVWTGWVGWMAEFSWLAIFFLLFFFLAVLNFLS